NVTQLLNTGCELADLQGHPISTTGVCADADVTIRYLEGDVEPSCGVDTLDTQAIAFRWGANKGSLLFNDRFNLEPTGAQADQDIDIKDLQFVYGRFGSSCAAPHPPQGPVNPKGGPAARVRVKQVDFKTDHNIIRDRLKPANAQKIDENPDSLPNFGTDKVEWKDVKPAFPDTVTEKNWPVTYVRNTKITLDSVTFRVELAGPPLANVKMRGTTTVGNKTLIFEKPGVTLNPGDVTVTNLTSNVELPNEVTLEEPMTINWQAVLADGSTIDAGQSKHNIYVTLKGPITTVYFTTLDLSTHGAAGAQDDAAAISGIWSQFEATAPTDTATGKTGKAAPEVRREEFDPVSGDITTKGHLSGTLVHGPPATQFGARLKYWTEVPPDKTLAGLFKEGVAFACTAFFTVEELLSQAEGRCGAWAAFFIHVLGNHGVVATNVHFGVTQENKCVVHPVLGKPSANCIFLVSTWTFTPGAANGGPKPGGTGNMTYPYKWEDVTDNNGVPGQGVRNPQPFFFDHAIVHANGQLYDPSYGLGPYAGATLTDRLQAYENANIAGYCWPNGQLQAAPLPGFPLRQVEVFICRPNLLADGLQLNPAPPPAVPEPTPTPKSVK
ncbi:MAG: hypothetical protein U1C74_10205, partial [Phenylobacterium sp.]|nr:hypothetical protein [Phenylobacterium sp.]